MEKITTLDCLVDVIGMLGNDHKVVSKQLEISEEELDQLVQRKVDFSPEIKTKVLKLFIKLEDNPDLWIGEPKDALDAATSCELMKDVVFVENDRRSTATRFPIC
jgi:hypothetical protein